MVSVKEDAKIRTYTGGHVYYFEPACSQISIEDVAHGLSMLCRFNGATKVFYSVAQHSVSVAEAIRRDGGAKKEIFSGLMHDASEAFISDVPSPFKKFFPGFLEAEIRMEEWLAKRFLFDFPYPKSVKYNDLRALATEMRDLMSESDEKQVDAPPFFTKIKPLNPEDSKRLFLAYYNEYKPN